MFEPNVKYTGIAPATPWRKTALGTWSVTGDSQIYSMVSVDAEPLLKYLEQRPGLTITHFMAAMLGRLIANHPQINSIERFGRIYRREEIAIFFQVASDKKGHDLSGYTVRNANTKTPEQVAEEMRENVNKIKSGDDINYKKVKSTLARIPGILMGPLLKVLGFILYKLNLWFPGIGSPKDSFGSMMVTNIGSLGMQRAWAPLVPYSHVPLIMTLGKVYERAVVKNGQVVAQKTIDCCFTTDHRIIDGMVGSLMEKDFVYFFTHPEEVK